MLKEVDELVGQVIKAIPTSKRQGIEFLVSRKLAKFSVFSLQKFDFIQEKIP